METMLPGEGSESSKAPVVLLATVERWTSTARLALALRSLGCELVLLGPRDHPAGVTDAISRHLRYDPLRPLQSLGHALRTVQPTVVLPADETAAYQLGELWQQMPSRKGAERDALAALIRRSLGDPERLCQMGSRMLLQRAAEADGIPTPATMEIGSEGDLQAAFERLGSPLVLKADRSSGGRGVRMADSLEDAQKIYRGFATAPHLPRAVLRGFKYGDWTHVRSSARRERRGVSAQTMVAGAERNAMVVAHRGQVLAIECFEVALTWKLRGPASVLRRVHDPRMEAAAHALVKRLEITGFCGFDFLVDETSGEPLLLECNARPTQAAHLALGPEHDLAAAYVRAVVGLPAAKDREPATARELIALFPQELQRDCESPALRAAFHDVPWESPALVDRTVRGDARLQTALAGERLASPVAESGPFQVAGSTSR